MTPHDVMRVVFNVPDDLVLDTIDRLRIAGFKLVSLNTTDNVVPAFSGLGETEPKTGPLPPRADDKLRRYWGKSGLDGEFLTIKEAAAILRIGAPAIYYRFREGNLEYYKVGGRTLVKRADIHNLILSGRRRGPAAAGDPNWRRNIRSLPKGEVPTAKSVDIPITAAMEIITDDR